MHCSECQRGIHKKCTFVAVCSECDSFDLYSRVQYDRIVMHYTACFVLKLSSLEKCHQLSHAHISLHVNSKYMACHPSSYGAHMIQILTVHMYHICMYCTVYSIAIFMDGTAGPFVFLLHNYLILKLTFSQRVLMKKTLLSGKLFHMQ